MKQFFIAIFAIVCSFGWAETIRIEPAKRQCVIILPNKANYGLKFAAEELTYHVEKLTGMKLETQTEPTDIPDGAFVFSLAKRISPKNTAFQAWAWLTIMPSFWGTTIK